MASAPPDFSLQKVSVAVIHTGNIINELKRRTAQSATQELLDSIAVTLESRVPPVNVSNGFNLSDSVDFFNDKHSVKINKEERKDLKLTVKVFLNTFEVESLIQAVSKALDELGVLTLETVIIALPPIEEPLKLDQIKPLWTTLERLVNEGKLLTIGISDLDTDLLIELHNWARIKPSVNQVNLASCCIIPPDMQSFAKENDIQLLTHNDPKEILPEAHLEPLLTKVETFPVAVRWQPQWIIRYSALVKCRGVIQNKGFLVCLKKKPS